MSLICENKLLVLKHSDTVAMIKIDKPREKLLILTQYAGSALQEESWGHTLKAEDKATY